MERIVWIVALTLAAVASVSCKDSTPNYISFDAQAPAQSVDAKPDAPPKVDAGSPSDAVVDTASAVDTALAADTAVDTAPADDDGGNGQ